jgi:uncharacterized protein (TIGR03545 family)
VRGTQLEGYDSITLNAEFNHIDPKNSFDRADLQIKSMAFNHFTLSGNDSFPLKLAQANTDITASAVVRKGALDFSLVALFQEAQFKSGAKSGAAKHLGEMLESIHQFDIKASAKGKLNNMSTSFSTSLERQLKQAMDDKIDKKKAELEAELRARLEAKVAEKTGKYGKDIEQLLSGQADMDEKLKQLETMGRAKLTTWEEQQKQELEAKKEAEKQKAQEKAKDAVQDQLRGLRR